MVDRLGVNNPLQAPHGPVARRLPQRDVAEVIHGRPAKGVGSERRVRRRFGIPRVIGLERLPIIRAQRKPSSILNLDDYLLVRRDRQPLGHPAQENAATLAQIPRSNR